MRMRHKHKTAREPTRMMLPARVSAHPNLANKKLPTKEMTQINIVTIVTAAYFNFHFFSLYS